MTRLTHCRTFVAQCRWFTVLVLLCGMTSAVTLIAEDFLSRWHWRNPLPQGHAIDNLIYANGQFVALSELGFILTSTNRFSWTRWETTLIDGINDCAFGSGRFVAVGTFGAIATSFDGLTWIPQFGGTFYSLSGVTYGNGLFVAVGEQSVILTSDDGMLWVTRASGPWDLADVTYSQGVFVAVGQGAILTSTDGIRWTRRSSPDVGTLRSVSHGAGEFFAVGSSSERTSIWFSKDGSSWRSHAIDSYRSFRALSYGHGIWLAAGGSEDNYFYEGNGVIYASTDTTNWTQVASNVATITGIAFSDPYFVAAGADGRFLMSSNGFTWFDPWQPPSPPMRTSRHVAFANNRFVAVSGNQIAWSELGYSWTNNVVLTNTDASFNLKSVAHGHGRYVAGGEYRTVWTSVDGVNWSNPAPNLSVAPYVRDVSAIAFGNGRFVAVARYQGDVLTSMDGLAWTAHRLETNDTGYLQFQDVAFGGGVFAAVGSWEKAASTVDGNNWMLHPLTGYFTGIAYGNGLFVAVGDNVVATSSNGVNWTTRAIQVGSLLRDVAFGQGWFVAVGGEFDDFGRNSHESPLLISQDGVTWIRCRSYTTQELSRIAYGHHTFVIATASGSILQSDPIIQLAIDLQSTPRLALSGPVDRTYRIEYTDAIAPVSHWQFLSNVISTSDPFPMLEGGPPSDNGTRFYRAILIP